MPAKSGDFIKYYLLKKENISYNKSIPIHFVSNLTTFLIILLFSSPVLFIYKENFVVYLVIALILLFFFSLKYPIIYIKFLHSLKKIVDLKIIDSLEKSLISSKKLLKIKDLLVSFILTGIYYFCIFIVFFFILTNFETNINPFVLFSIYSLSLIIGAISMIPGGVGVVEGGSILLLSNFLNQNDAIILIMIMRFLTLWITMFIGFFALSFTASLKNLDKI